MDDDVSVLIVDDSALMRNLIGQIVEATPGLTVADKAMNGLFALQKIPRCNPDIIVLDIEMPEMNGVTFLQERKKLGITIPVIILSSIASKGAKVTMECLGLGASDFITKPSGSISLDIQTVGKQLGELLLAYGSKYKLTKRSLSATTAIPLSEKTARQSQSNTNQFSQTPRQEQIQRPSLLRTRQQVQLQPVRQLREPEDAELIAIGISTGGPNALREVFAKLDPSLPLPIVVVQHMPAGFTKEFAESLNRISTLKVKEAEEGDILKTGTIYIAPGNYHVEVEKQPAHNVIHLSEAPPQNGHRPSADVLFSSVAKYFQNHAIGIIMTGMGRDGAAAIGAMYREGALTIGQDESTSIVYGMPRVAYEMGHIVRQVSLSDMAEEINTSAKALAWNHHTIQQ